MLPLLRSRSAASMPSISTHVVYAPVSEFASSRPRFIVVLWGLGVRLEGGFDDDGAVGVGTSTPQAAALQQGDFLLQGDCSTKCSRSWEPRKTRSSSNWILSQWQKQPCTHRQVEAP